MPPPRPEQLPRREREIVDALFALGDHATAEAIRERLADPPSYSAVRAMLARLEAKGYVRHREEGLRYVYSPTIPRTAARRAALQQLVRVFFGGSPGEITEAWKDEATGGFGADLALVTAAASTSEPIALAAELCRRKGRIALVGAMPMQLDRRTFYEKELRLEVSMSYGPGRYDRSYEEVGLDYPLPYVRWTENRNLQAFLALVAAGSVRPERLAIRSVPFAEAEPSESARASEARAAVNSAQAKGATLVGVSGRDLIMRYTHVPPVPDWRLEMLMNFEIQEVSEQSGGDVSAAYAQLEVDDASSGDNVVLVALAKNASSEPESEAVAAA